MKVGLFLVGEKRIGDLRWKSECEKELSELKTGKFNKLSLSTDTDLGTAKKAK